MKLMAYSVLSFILLGCSSQCPEIDGNWKVISPFYNASFNIQNIDGSLQCSVLTYDDGTTRFDNRGKSSYYLTQNLQCKDGIFIDGISGATTLEKSSLTIKKVAFDTLSVTMYIMNNPLNENWIKIE